MPLSFFISQFLFCGLIFSPNRPHIYCILTSITRYLVVILFKDEFCNSAVIVKCFIIKIYVGRSFNRYAEHPQFISLLLNHFKCCLHCTELCTGGYFSIVGWLFLYQFIGHIFININTTVCIILLLWWPVWFTSIKHVTMSSCPLDSVILGGGAPLSYQ